MGFLLAFSTVRYTVEETEKIIPGTLPRQGGWIHPYSKTRGPYSFTSTSGYTRGLPSPPSSVSILSGTSFFQDSDKLKISLLSGTIMKVVYDIDIQESDDPYISVVEKVLKAIHEASMPGTFLVDLLPMLKIVPSWFPGAGFQMKAAYGKELTRSMIEKPYRYVEKQLVGCHSFERYSELF